MDEQEREPTSYDRKKARLAWLWKNDPEFRAKKIEYQRRWRANPGNRAAYLAYLKEYKSKNSERIKQSDKAYYRRNARKFVLAKFGITEVEYDRMLAAQGGVCAVCGGPPGGRWKTYHVDHCHSTGAIRGLLCNRCNNAIGQFGDDRNLLLRAAEYLARQTPL